MKKSIILLLLLSSLNLFSITLTLKENVFLSENFCTLYDVISNDEKIELNNFNLIFGNENDKIILSSKDLLNSLFRQNIFNVTLIGDQVEINFTGSKSENNSNIVPYSALKNYFENQLNKNNYIVKLKINSQTSNINLNEETDSFKWDLPKISNLLKDYRSIKKINFFYDSNKYTADIDLTILTKTWVAENNCQKDSLLQKKDFKVKFIDSALIKESENLINDIDSYKDYKFSKNVKAGEILYFNQLKRNPLVLKNESVKVYYSKNQFEIYLDSISLQDGFENQKIKVKLTNKKEVHGILKIYNGVKYVQI